MGLESPTQPKLRRLDESAFLYPKHAASRLRQEFSSWLSLVLGSVLCVLDVEGVSAAYCSPLSVESWAIWNWMSCRKATGEGRKSGETMDEGLLSLAGWVYDIETPQALLLVSIQIWKGHCYLGGGSS
jgi:hypothetical protein